MYFTQWMGYWRQRSSVWRDLAFYTHVFFFLLYSSFCGPSLPNCKSLHLETRKRSQKLKFSRPKALRENIIE